MKMNSINRRKFLELSGAASAGLAAPGLGVANSRRAADDRQNILLIMTDQQFADAMSCAGNPDGHTPNMDSLAEHGVRFTRAYCANPLCTPSRGTIMSGRMPHEIGITVNVSSSQKLPSQTMGKVMTAAGYDCGYVGKWHLPQTPYYHGFAFCRENSVNDIDHKMVDDCVEFLRIERDRPFLLVASFINPHDICEWARDPKTAKRNGEAQYITDPPIDQPPPSEQCPKLPPNFEPSTNEPTIIRQINKSHKRIHPPGWFPKQWTESKWRQYRWAYNRMVELVDMFIGQILQALRESGREKNTVVIFTSDHGDGYAGHRWNQKWIHYEESVRVPLIIAQKGKTAPGVADDRLVAVSEDLLPTLCDYAGIAPPDGVDGKSLRPLVGGTLPAAWRSFLVSESEWDADLFAIGENVRARMVRTGKFKYIVYSKASVESADGLREQLFDMQNDPGEMINLAVKAEFRAVLDEHRALLRQWGEKTHDVFPVPEGSPTGV
ncbi:MAG: sulfatase-like hydrolase/transferase [Calditrichaeota bacterium]|nr:sulfatase-like hydrolase/transferase [Calditrichota bacterium]